MYDVFHFVAKLLKPSKQPFLMSLLLHAVKTIDQWKTPLMTLHTRAQCFDCKCSTILPCFICRSVLEIKIDLFQKDINPSKI